MGVEEERGLRLLIGRKEKVGKGMGEGGDGRWPMGDTLSEG